MGRPAYPLWTRTELRKIRRALALVLLLVLFFVLALVLLFVQIFVVGLVVLERVVLEFLILLAFEKVGQHQTVELREPLIGVCLALEVCARRMPEPRQGSCLVAPGQQRLGIGIEQPCGPGLPRSSIELGKLQPHNGSLVLTKVTANT